MAANTMTLIEKLSGRDNYSTWKFAVQTYLQHEELWDCITNPNPVDLKKDLKAKSKLILLIDSVNYIHIQEAKTAHEIWNNLEKAFDDSGLTRRVGLIRDLCTTTLAGCQNVEEYIAKIMTTAHKLRNIGFKVDDEWLGTMLLSGLPDTYKPMIMAIESSGMKISADLIKAKILQDVKLSDTTAFVTNHKKKNKVQRKGPRCYNCNRFGHISTECKIPKKNKNYNSENSNYAAAFMVSDSNNDYWYIDSGASTHMTKHQHLLQNETSAYIKSIRVANDKSLQVKGSGQVSLKVQNNKNEYKTILFRNVLYVPELATNLISVSQIIKNGGQVKFNNKGCLILNQNKEVVATASLINNMYRLNISNEFAYISDVNEQDPYLWHQRMGHLNFPDLKKIEQNTKGIISLKKTEDIICVTCLESKQTRFPFKSQGTRAKNLLELVHSDICGPMETISLGGARYLLTFIDDFSKKVYVYFLHKKSEVSQTFKEFKRLVENQLECNIKCLRTDNGLEYVNKDMSDFLKQYGIIHQTTTPYTPELNGVAERMNRTLVEKAKCLLLNAKLNKQYWAEAVHTAAYLINRTPTKSLSYKTPEEMWTGQKPDINHLKIFGCEAMIHIPKEKSKKWDPKAQKAIFMGYCDNMKGYRFIIPPSKNIIRSRNAVFLESSINGNYVPLHLIESQCENDEDSNESLNSVISDDEKLSDNTSDSLYVPDESIGKITCTKRNLRSRNKQKSLMLKENQESGYLCTDKIISNFIPLNYNEAINSSDSENWRKSIVEELDAHHRNGTWTLVEKPPDVKPIQCKWVFRIKDEPTGLRYKSRLCAKGYAQTKGIDYDETYSPTVRYDSIRLLLSIAAQKNLDFIQFDITTAFLNSDLKENIYMITPEGLNCESNLVCKLNKSLYGLKQASRCWNIKFNSILNNFGFKQCYSDQCVYVANIKGKKCYLCLYVDDGLLFYEDKSILQDVINGIKDHFDIKTSFASNFVSMQIIKNEKYIFIHQSKYIDQLLNRFNMIDINPNSIPADPHVRLHKSEDQPNKNYPYREAVGSLIHAATVSRPDIMFAVNMVSRFLNCYNEQHWNAIKKIFKYLKDTKDYGIFYKSNSSNTDLIGYCDADYANDLETRRSITGYVFLKNEGAVTWTTQKQNSVALSTTEAEYMACCAATKEAIWLKQLLTELGEYNQNSICLNIDNQSAISVIKNGEFHKRCKHIDVKYNFVKENYEQGIISLNYVCTDNQYADVFTKALSNVKFKLCRSKIGLSCL